MVYCPAADATALVCKKALSVDRMKPEVPSDYILTVLLLKALQRGRLDYRLPKTIYTHIQIFSPNIVTQKSKFLTVPHNAVLIVPNSIQGQKYFYHKI